MSFRFATVALVMSVVFSTFLNAADSRIDRIEIKSSWSGLGNPRESTLVITSDGERYFANGEKIDRHAVDALIAAIQQPPVEHPSLEECGITQQWLLENFKKGLETVKHEKIRNLPPKGVELFKRSFTSPTEAQTAFARLYEFWHTDDDPKMSVTLFASGREFGIRSISQNEFMLPWLGTDARGGSYSCRISQAIAALLAKGFTNKERLVPNAGFRWELVQSVMQGIEHDWNLLDTEFKVGPAVEPIFAQYSPVESAISNLASVDLDGGAAWNARLRSSDLPPNVLIGVSLRFRKRNKLEGVGELMTRLPNYSRLVLSVPWLSAYLAAHPKTMAELRYVNGRSLSSTAQASLIKDLQDHGKAELADMVLQQGADSAFLEVDAGKGCWARVIVFPSKEVLIWHFKCDSVLGFPAQDFDSWDYSGWRSAGALVREDGTLVKSSNKSLLPEANK